MEMWIITTMDDRTYSKYEYLYELNLETLEPITRKNTYKWKEYIDSNGHTVYVDKFNDKIWIACVYYGRLNKKKVLECIDAG